MEQIRTDRLRVLAEHLLHGKLGHDKFNFALYSIKEECGTMGCAIGECPFVFPEDWHFDYADDPVVKGISTEEESGQIFFNLKREMYDHLFIASYQDISKFGGMHLDKNATKEEVANNIIAFCDLVDAGKITIN